LLKYGTRTVLTTSYLGAFVGTESHKAALTKLVKAGYLYHLPESTHHRNARYRDMCWSLTEKGDALYESWGGTEPHRNLNGRFRHAFGVSLIGASFDFAARETGQPLTIHAEKPPKYGTVFPDEPPFSLGCLDFVGFEFDRNTETLSGDADNTIEEKLRGYEQFFKKGLFREYKLDLAYIPFITINETHMRNLMALVEEQVTPKLHKRFLFKTIPDFSEYDSFPPANGHIITEPWHRIGGSFNLLEILNGHRTAGSAHPKAEATRPGDSGVRRREEAGGSL
jgi:hypothetical protein